MSKMLIVTTFSLLAFLVGAVQIRMESSSKPDNSIFSRLFKWNTAGKKQKKKETSDGKEVPQPMRFILLGSTNGSGKSCLVQRFARGFYTPSFITTIGVDFVIKTVEVDGHQIKLQIWDTAGRQGGHWEHINEIYCRGMHAGLMVYAIDSRQTFEEVTYWLNLFTKGQSRRPPKGMEGLQPALTLIGNRCDLETGNREVPFEEGKKFAEDHGMLFFETSAKYDINVSQAFLSTLAQAYQNLLGTPGGIYEVVLPDKIVDASKRRRALGVALGRTGLSKIPKPIEKCHASEANNHTAKEWLLVLAQQPMMGLIFDLLGPSQ